MDSWQDLFDRAAPHGVETAAVRAAVAARRDPEREGLTGDEASDGGER